ncbi:MAG: aldehyde ferredoxin oxidoreductase family protein [Anaerolineales bacterium]|nr:aldehyde ferredoxin oxidoreductase family protein [Anaerolineales bacterium]
MMRYESSTEGYCYRVLHVDLETGQVRDEKIKGPAAAGFLGGAGMAAHLIYDELVPDLDPLSPEAPLVIATGPLTGTTGPAVGRYVICAKSPATWAWGEANVGGLFGPELRAAGIDALVLRGRSPQPVYLCLLNGVVELRPANQLWGHSDTYETQDLIKEDLKKPGVKVACIGRAGEAQLPFAIVLCDHGRVAGRTGMGAVMGSKNLKAIAVLGDQPIPLAGPERFSLLRARINRELRQDLVSEGLRDFGTSSGLDIFDYFGMLPKKYFREGVLDGVEAISGASMAETILSGVSTCHGCVIACGRKVRINEGPERKGPEYETKIGFGPNLGITDLKALVELGDLCDRYGMDTISLSNTIGLAIALYEDGMISGAQTGGLQLEWGDAEVVAQLVHQTAAKAGFGELLSQGALWLAGHFGVPDRALQVRGLELAYHDPRGASGMALVYATSPRGACHNQSPYYLVEIGQTREEIGIGMHPRQGGEEKVLNVVRHQDWTTLQNSLVMCIFANVPAGEVCELLTAATGYDLTTADLMRIGERSFTLKRMINVRLGRGVDDDTYPEPLFEPLAEGGAAGYVPPLENMLRVYYKKRGWSLETGMPDESTLQHLGLASYSHNHSKS